MVSMPNGDEKITGWNMHPSNAHDARGGVAEFFPKDTTPQWFDCVFVVPRRITFREPQLPINSTLYQHNLTQPSAVSLSGSVTSHQTEPNVTLIISGISGTRFY